MPSPFDLLSCEELEPLLALAPMGGMLMLFDRPFALGIAIGRVACEPDPDPEGVDGVAGGGVSGTSEVSVRDRLSFTAARISA
jgi:hypothetical protein